MAFLEASVKVKIRIAVAMNDIGVWTAIGNVGALVTLREDVRAKNRMDFE